MQSQIETNYMSGCGIMQSNQILYVLFILDLENKLNIISNTSVGYEHVYIQSRF